MNQRIAQFPTFLSRISALLAIACALCIPASAQTPGGTTISNQASATYSDGTNSYSTISNTVTVTVSNVAGLAITPDAGSNPTVVAGQTGVLYAFTVTNTGNFSDQVRFLSGSARVNAPNTVTQAVIDVDASGTINAGDTDITTGAVSSPVAQNGSLQVLVEVSVDASVSPGQSVTVTLGDAAGGGPSFDNQPSNTSLLEVRTESALSVNGKIEARGDISATVVDDALMRLTLTAPAGPVNLGSDITYTWQLANTSTTHAISGVTLNAATRVYIIAPIPARTVLKSGQTFPAGTLYTTSPLTTAPLSATWAGAAPPLNTVTRIAFPVGVTLAASTSSAAINMEVTVDTGINATIPIDEIGDAFGKNSLGANITDQSGDATSNYGDGNADFDEGYVVGAGDGDGVIQQTTLTQVGSVFLGPSGAPSATGPTDQNDDYTNKSTNPGNIAPGGNTTASGQLIYVNTLLNSGNADDTYTVDAPTVPAGFLVEISTDGGTAYTDVSSGGSVSVPLTFGNSANIHVRVTVPIGKPVLTAFATTIRAASTVTPAATNSTIDRAYTGFVRLDKTATVVNSTGVGGATDPVPGAVINYSITYTNISSSNGDASCVKLTASNLVITEDGLIAPNNWGTYTTNSGAPADSGSGVVNTVSATKYTDTVASVAPGTSGIFTFSRSID